VTGVAALSIERTIVKDQICQAVATQGSTFASFATAIVGNLAFLRGFSSSSSSSSSKMSWPTTRKRSYQGGISLTRIEASPFNLHPSKTMTRTIWLRLCHAPAFRLRILENWWQSRRWICRTRELRHADFGNRISSAIC